MMRDMQDFVDMLTGDAADDDRQEHYSKVKHVFDNLEKVSVLQEARIFHDDHEVRENPRQCCRILAQLVRLNDLGTQPFTETEATEVFFGATKLFLSDDASLRRMVYLFLKEIYTLCDPNNVIIVTSSLTKDMTCDLNLYRANSLRVLVRIIDSAMLGAIERYIKQAIVDQSSQVSSSALVSAVHLYNSSPDSAAIVRRWIGETQQAIKSRHEMVQFHGIQLMYLIKSHDRLGVSKLVSQYGQQKSIKSPLARVLLIRYAAKLIRDEVAEGRVYGMSVRNATAQCREGFELLERSLKDPSDMVVYEAARAICSLPMTEPEDLNQAIDRLQLFLLSKKPTVRFATVKTLSSVATRQPRLVSKCNPELEKLIKDSNVAVATHAVSVLLRTASESSVDELLTQISPFLDDVSDDYRINVVKSLLQLCLRFPSKHLMLVAYLSRFLRDQGSFEFKRSVVSGIISLIRAHPEAAESSLLHLCEYIEDCEYEWLSVEILHILAEYGPTTLGRTRYIRFIYNRTMLDRPQIRAAAVTALSKFAIQCPSLRPSILMLLNRCLVDVDDETRDRAVVAVNIIEQALNKNPYVAPAADADADEIPPDVPSEDDLALLAFAPLDMSFEKLERSLEMYKQIPGALESAEPLTLSSLPVVEERHKVEVESDENEINSFDGGIETPEKVSVKKDPAMAIYEVPELASFGRVFRSSVPLPLTESETEYVVHCIKHILDDHVILQFQVQNTIEDQSLNNVTVSVAPDEDDLYESVGEIAAEDIRYGETKDCFTILERKGAAIRSCSFSCEMHFRVASLEGGEDIGESYEEEYPLESFAILPSDYMAKVAVPDFRKAWEGVGSENEILEKFALQFKSQEEAVSTVLELLAMEPCDNTGKIVHNDKPQILHLSGVFLGGVKVLARARLSTDKDNGAIILQIAVRSEDALVSQLVLDSIN